MNIHLFYQVSSIMQNIPKRNPPNSFVNQVLNGNYGFSARFLRIFLASAAIIKNSDELRTALWKMRNLLIKLCPLLTITLHCKTKTNNHNIHLEQTESAAALRRYRLRTHKTSITNKHQPNKQLSN